MYVVTRLVAFLGIHADSHEFVFGVPSSEPWVVLAEHSFTTVSLDSGWIRVASLEVTLTSVRASIANENNREEGQEEEIGLHFLLGLELVVVSN